MLPFTLKKFSKLEDRKNQCKIKILTIALTFYSTKKLQMKLFFLIVLHLVERAIKKSKLSKNLSFHLFSLGRLQI